MHLSESERREIVTSGSVVAHAREGWASTRPVYMTGMSRIGGDTGVSIAIHDFTRNDRLPGECNFRHKRRAGTDVGRERTRDTECDKNDRSP